MVLSNIQKQADFRKRMKDAGYMQFHAWIKKEHKETVKEFCDKLEGEATKNN